MKKILACLLALVLVLSCATAMAADWKFERRVEIMIPAAAGGGLDSTLRAFGPYLEKELGTNIMIDNRGGANAVTGYTFSYSQPRDGYVFQFTAPTAIASCAQGNFPFDMWSELVPVSGLVQADAMFFANPNKEFKTMDEMMAYAKENPGKVSVAVDTPNGITGAVLKTYENNSGLSFKWVAGESDEVTISTIAGETDIVLGTWADCGAYVESGDLIALCFLANQRNPVAPEVPCCGEVGIEMPLGFYRVFTCLKGTPQEAIDAFSAAVKRATETPEWQEWLTANGMTNDYVYTAEELGVMLNASYETMGALFAAK